jgi:glutamine cyclotransferase
VTRVSAVNGRLTAALCCVLALAGALQAQPLRTVPVVKPEILRVVGHDPAAFTQGLVFVDTALYESTGLAGKSSLRRVDAATGKVLLNVPVPDVFAEGIAVFGGELVQLTWQDGFALRYEFPALKTKSTMYRYKGEGWGLTNDSAGFIMSNGSDTLYFRNDIFEVTRALPVTYYGRPLTQLNELEYARGHVYANVWYRNFIAEISVADGSVRRVIDCTELIKAEVPASGENVLNGIAYRERTDEWYLTGKNWKNMFVVRIPR